MEHSKLVLSGLSSLDEEELLEALGKDQVEFIKAKPPEGSLAEPATITAVIVLTSAGIAALTAYLAKGRRRRILKGVKKIIHPDGRIEEMTIDLDEASEDALKASVLGELGKWIQ
jgi:hypothetical protein